MEKSEVVVYVSGQHHFAPFPACWNECVLSPGEQRRSSSKRQLLIHALLLLLLSSSVSKPSSTTKFSERNTTTVFLLYVMTKGHGIGCAAATPRASSIALLFQKIDVYVSDRCPLEHLVVWLPMVQ